MKIIHLQLVVQKIEFHLILWQKANWNSIVFPTDPHQKYIVILNKLGYIKQEKRKIIQRGLLDWLLPIWTLPCTCEIHDKMQVVYNELTCNWVKSMVAVAWKVHHQSHLVLCEFFLVELENAFGICDKMQVAYKEMTHDRAKSKGAKWNLIGEVQFKHMKNCIVFMSCNDWVCSDWILNIISMVLDRMWVV